MNTTLRLGHVGLVDSAPLLVAAQQGYFRDEGLAIELVHELGLSTLGAKLIDGRLAGACLPAPLAVTLSLGLPSGYVQLDMAILLTWQDLAIVRSISSPADGSPAGGWKIGLPAQATGARLLVQHWLEQQAPVPEHTFVPLSINQLPSFFKERLIDGFCGLEPLTLAASLDQGGEIVATSATLCPLHPGGALVLRADRSRQDAGLLAALSRALRRAAEACADPTQAATMWALVLAQPPWAEWETALHAALTAPRPPVFSARFQPPATGAVNAEGATFLEEACRTSLRSALRGYDVRGQIKRLFATG